MPTADEHSSSIQPPIMVLPLHKYLTTAFSASAGPALFVRSREKTASRINRVDTKTSGETHRKKLLLCPGGKSNRVLDGAARGRGGQVGGQAKIPCFYFSAEKGILRSTAVCMYVWGGGEGGTMRWGRKQRGSRYRVLGKRHTRGRHCCTAGIICIV